MTALAVAYGYKFGGMLGTIVALSALALPAFVLSVALTLPYRLSVLSVASQVAR